MASKQLDDLDWDLSLDYEFEDPFAPVSQQKKRGVITRMATNFSQGAMDAFKTPSTLRTIAANMLPKGYGTAINFGTDLYRQGEELHNIAQKELGPSLPAMRRITQRHLPKIKQYAPRAITERLEEFSKPRPSYKGVSEAQEIEDSIRAAMADVFEVEVEAESRQQEEERVERALQHSHLASTGRDQLRALELTQQGVMRLVDYQDSITNRYQRRSLELQTRHYLLARDQARVQIESTRRMHAQLQMIADNSAMPDIAKQDLRHTATQTFRNRLLGSMQDSAGRFAQNYMGNVFKRMRGSVRDLVGGVGQGIEASEMAEDLPLVDMLMQSAGQGAVNMGARFGGRFARDAISKLSPDMAQLGGRLHRVLTSVPQYLNRYARSATEREGIWGLGEEMIKDILPTHTMDAQIGTSGLADMDRPATFDKLARLSLVEVIPGFLSRIEHNTARALDAKAERQMYNMDRRKFTNLETAADDMANRLMPRETRASAKQQVNQFIDQLIGNEPLSEGTRKGLFRQLLIDSGNGLPFDPEHYISAASKTPELDARAKAELAQVFKKVGVLKNGQRDQVWLADRAEQFNQLNFGAIAPIHAAGVYRSAGYRDLIDQVGMLERDGFKDNLNISKILDMIEEADYGDIKVKELSAVERLHGELGKRVNRFGEQVGDLYKEGGVQAILTAARLKTGAYRDQATGQVIAKWEDIKGPVLDLTTNTVVLSGEDLTQPLVDAKGKRIPITLRTLAAGARSWAEDLNKSAQPMANRTREVLDVMNHRGEVLLAGARLMAGKYFDALTNRPLERPEDIAGPVVDEEGRTVVTSADIVQVLQDSKGRKLTGATERMQSRVDNVQPDTSINDAPTSMFGSQETDPNQVQQPMSMITMDNSELIRLNSEQVELLKIIADTLMRQGPGDGGEGEGRQHRGFLDTIALGGIKGAWKGAKATARGALWWAKKVWGGAAGAFGLGGRAAGAMLQGGAHRIGNMVRGIKDIHIKGKRKPALVAQRIKLGHYRDVNTGKKVTRWTDITGPVEDVTSGETVIDQDDYDAGIYVKGPAGLVRLATQSVKTFGSAVVSFYGQALALPFKAAGMVVKGIAQTMKWVTNKQVDVYVKGESTPRLHATKMKLGRYYNVNPKKMGVKVKTYDDIHGEIKELQPGEHKAQVDDKTVLYEEEITDPGLSNRWGMSLRTPLSRLVGAVGGAAVSVVKGAAALFGGAMKGYGKLFGGLMGFGGAAIGAPFKFLGSLLNPFEKHGAKQVELLESIRDLLDARLPGGKPRKGSWQEQFAKREELKKDEEEQRQTEERERKWGVGSLLSFFKDKTKGLFGGGRDEEGEDEDSDGGTTIIAGGGGGDGKGKGKRKSHGPAKTGGRFNRFRRNRAASKLKRNRSQVKAPSKLGGLGRAGTPAALAASFMADPLMDAVGVGEDSIARDAVSTGMNAWGLYSLATMAKGTLGLGAGTTATAAGASALGATGAATAGTAALGAGATAAGGTGVLGGAAATVGGGAAAVLGAPIWIPVAIGAAALAAAGTVGYFTYRQIKYGKLTPSRRFRFLQYGVKPGDAGNNRKIFLLEELLMNHVGERNGVVDIVSKSNASGKSISMEDVYEIFGLNDGWFSNNSSQRAIFNTWYNNRFKPIFLTWHAAVKSQAPTMSILEADEKLENDKMTKVLDKAWAMSHTVYGVSAGPIEGEAAVTNTGEIEEAYLLAKKEAGKSEEQKSKDKRHSRMKTALKWMGGPVTALAVSYLDNRTDETKAKRESEELSMQKLTENTGEEMIKAKGGIRFTQTADELLTSPLARSGKVTSLGALRYRSYGLNDLELDRVRALAALETLIGKAISISDTGRVHVFMGTDEVYTRICGLFGLTSGSVQDRQRWSVWFNKRFLPTFTAYVQTVRRLSPSADLQQPERLLKADQQLEVGQAILNAKTEDGDTIWKFTVSPWSSQERLLSDSNQISGTLIAMRQSADKQLAGEPTVAGRDAAVEQNRGYLARMWDSTKVGAEGIRDWLLGEKDDRNWLGRAVDGVGNVVRNMTQGVSNVAVHLQQGEFGAAAHNLAMATSAPARALAGGMGFGPGLNHPGKGTGGDINSLPEVPSNAEIAAMKPAQRFAVLKPLFDAVAKMTGVDPNMLYAIASIESTFNPNAKAPTSSASGLFQFLRGTWAESLRKHGTTFGVSPTASPFDVKANTLMGAMFLKDNFTHLKSRLSRGINETDMYMAHFMGRGGAVDFLRRDPNENAVRAFPTQAKSNPWIFYAQKKQGSRTVPDESRPLTVGQVYALMQEKVSKAQSVYGGRKVTADFSDVSGSSTTTASVETTQEAAPSDTSSHTEIRTPTTTTTTANGEGGGVGAVQSPIAPTPAVGAQVAVSAGSTGVALSATGGGYADMAGTGALPGADQLATPAPHLDSVNSLDAAAQSAARDEQIQREAQRRAAAQEERRRREVDAQSQRQSAAEQQQYGSTVEVLRRQLETQVQIQKNTADTVGLLRQMLHSSNKSTSEDNASASSPQVSPTRERPFEGRDGALPISVRFPPGK